MPFAKKKDLFYRDTVTAHFLKEPLRRILILNIIFVGPSSQSLRVIYNTRIALELNLFIYLSISTLHLFIITTMCISFIAVLQLRDTLSCIEIIKAAQASLANFCEAHRALRQEPVTIRFIFYEQRGNFLKQWRRHSAAQFRHSGR